MNTNLIEALIKEQGYCIDNIDINYDCDIVPCEYRVSVTLCAGNMEKITFYKEYIDSEDSLMEFGDDLKAIGEIYINLGKGKEANND